MVEFTNTSEFERENEATFRRVVEPVVTSAEFIGPDTPPLLLPFVVLGDVPEYVHKAYEIKRRERHFGNKTFSGDDCDLELFFLPLFVRADEVVKVKNAQIAVFYIPDNDEWLKVFSGHI